MTDGIDILVALAHSKMAVAEGLKKIADDLGGIDKHCGSRKLAMVLSGAYKTEADDLMKVADAYVRTMETGK